MRHNARAPQGPAGIPASWSRSRDAKTARHRFSQPNSTASRRASPARRDPAECRVGDLVPEENAADSHRKAARPMPGQRAERRGAQQMDGVFEQVEGAARRRRLPCASPALPCRLLHARGEFGDAAGAHQENEPGEQQAGRQQHYRRHAALPAPCRPPPAPFAGRRRRAGARRVRSRTRGSRIARSPGSGTRPRASRDSNTGGGWWRPACSVPRRDPGGGSASARHDTTRPAASRAIEIARSIPRRTSVAGASGTAVPRVTALYPASI